MNNNTIENPNPKRVKKKSSGNSKWLAILSVVAILLVSGGLFTYYNFFRQDNANLIETVPDDALFIFQINDNEQFAKSTSQLSSTLDELFSMGSFAGFQSLLNKAAFRNSDRQKLQVIVSGHPVKDKLTALYSCAMKSHIFNKLLKTLKIDSRNCTIYNQNEIYSFGTHYRKFYFSWHHNVFSVSESVDLLKKSLDQHQNVNNLLSDKNFKGIYELVKKNERQNWFLTHYSEFLALFKEKITENHQDLFSLENNQNWAAYQVRFTENEFKWAGYVQQSDLQYTNGNSADFPSEIFPESTDYYVSHQTPAPYYLFSLTKDTVTYQYCAVPADTLQLPYSKLLPEGHTLDSCEKFKNVPIYQSALHNAEITSNVSIVATNYFIEKEGYLIFSDTVAALQRYINFTNTAATITDNPAYRATKNNMPQQNTQQISYFFNSPVSRFLFFSETGLKLHTAQNISAFSFAITPSAEGLATSNLYIKF